MIILRVRYHKKEKRKKKQKKKTKCASITVKPGQAFPSLTN